MRRPAITTGARRLAVVAALFAASSPADGQLPGRDRALEGQPTDVYRVGTENGRDFETFSNVPAVAFDAAGWLYVLDRDNARILVFDRTGRYVRQIGRKGQGPGELGLPMALTVTPAGEVVVYDLMNGGLSVFGTDGEYRTLVRLPTSMRVDPALGMVPHPQGGVVLAASQLPGLDGGAPEAAATVPILRVPLDGGASVTVYDAPSPKPEIVTSGGANERQVSVQPPPTFSPRVRFGVAPDGRLIVSHDTDWALTVVDGGRTSKITRPMQARAVTDRDREAAKDERAAALRSGAGMIRMEVVNGQRTASVGGQGLPEAQVQQMLAGMRFAETVPQIRDVAVDPMGRIWVSREGGAGRTEGPIDLVAAAGPSYLGSLPPGELPDAFGPDGLAAWIVTDELDVPSVVVRRLPASWR